MKKYAYIKEKVKKIEYKLGTNYTKTDSNGYKYLRILNALCIIYLAGVNILTLLSASLREKYLGNKYFEPVTFWLLIAGTCFEIAAIVLNRLNFSITANILSIIPLPYFLCVFAPMLTHPDGLWGYRSEFYFRHLISYVLILIFSFAMLFIAIRQHIKTRKLYNRVLDNIYEEFKKANASDDFTVSEKEWDKYVKNFDPRKKKIE